MGHRQTITNSAKERRGNVARRMFRHFLPAALLAIPLVTGLGAESLSSQVGKVYAAARLTSAYVGPCGSYCPYPQNPGPGEPPIVVNPGLNTPPLDDMDEIFPGDLFDFFVYTGPVLPHPELA